MENKVQKEIVDYFSFFEEFHNTSKACLKNCQDCAISINKLIKRCNNIQEAEIIGTPLENFENLQYKLSGLLHNKISQEILEIRSELSKVEDLFEKLSHKHQTLLESCRNLDLEETTPIVKGTPLQPPLKKLLEFAEDSLSFGSEVCAQIDTSLNVLTYKGLKTESLVDNFKIQSHWQLRIPEIISYTSFCSDNSTLLSI
ncbi:unnamed protein product [Diatraea saccharalis]|uniref:Uncharacterized protein n=1 Tax=Diatraea saccharalis TaxID=40085 RepID=A0A9N9RB28_9NEOP|nr:unnamed protein product [Diatraea saccharalis]